MLKPEDVPKEVVQAYKRHLENNTWTTHEAAIAAAINAWPGASTGPNIYGRQDAVIHLPLNTEPDNAEA